MLFQNFSFRQKIGRYLLNTGISYSYNDADLQNISFSNTLKISEIGLANKSNYLNFKTFAERRINKISAVRAGFEFNNSHEINTRTLGQKSYQNISKWDTSTFMSLI